MKTANIQVCGNIAVYIKCMLSIDLFSIFTIIKTPRTLAALAP